MQMVVEYLVILPKDDSFCDGTDTLTRLLQVDSKISLKKEILTFGGFSCDFRVASGEVAGKEQRFFHLRLATNTGQENAEEGIEAFTMLLKRIRTILAKAGGAVEVLWDDISFRYSKDAYAKVTVHRFGASDWRRSSSGEEHGIQWLVAAGSQRALMG